MAPGQDELRVPLHWSSNGVDVVKEFVFHRGSYAIGVTQTVDNHSTAPWVVAPYAQILRSDAPIKSSYFSTNPERFASRGPAIWDGGKYRKLKITDDDDRHLNIPVRNGWIAALQHYFVTAVVPPPDVDYHFTLTSQGIEYAMAATAPLTDVGGRCFEELFIDCVRRAEAAGSAGLGGPATAARDGLRAPLLHRTAAVQGAQLGPTWSPATGVWRFCSSPWC